MSALIRAFSSVYLSAQIRLTDFQEVMGRVHEGTSFRALTSGKRQKTCIQFSPLALLNLQSWAQALQSSPHKLIEDATLGFLAFADEVPPPLRDYWRRNLLPQIELILRSV
ncbi:MAG: hypothetical protein HC902_15045 [Calothrix sp. SM1_5_4]|nr:hypothetical protein [Calothrix sp. SM1_5_4]